jgi:rubrerythrin
MLRWVRTMMVAAGALGSAACSWVPAKDVLEIKAPARKPRKLVGGYLNQQECRRLCKATRDDDTPERCMLVTMAVAPREYDVRDASPAVAELVATAETPASEPGATRGAKAAEVAVLCENHLPGYFETFKGFGRGSLAAVDLREAPRSAAEHYLRAAYAETAAILSFQQLAFDLEALGASRRLIRAARRAAREEASHARVSLAVARRLGAARPHWPPWPRPLRRTPRLVDVALENATNGCVSELFGTYLQLYQARHVKDPDLRAIAGRIAREEASHAALAFRLFDHFDARLTPDQRRQVRASMREALGRCEASLGHSPELLRELGLPDRAAVRSMMREIEASL